jgi:hexosaminidase
MSKFELYPRPQWLRLEEERWLLPGRVSVAIRENRLRALAALLRDWLAMRGVRAEITHEPVEAKAEFTLGLLSEESFRQKCQSAGWLTEERAAQPEGYILHVGEQGATLAGADEAGLFYGLQTLHQLFQSDGAVRHAAVQDWPYKKMRGIHLYMPGREQLPFLKETLATLAAYKYNTLFLEVGGGMRYDRHLEVNAGWEEFCAAMNTYPGGQQAHQSAYPFPKDSCHVELGHGGFLEKDEVRQIISWAKQNHIEIIPELQSLSHSYYMLAAHRDLAERDDDPWPDTYCPSNPDSYKLYFELLDEVIELFRPRMIHIGHDEVYIIGSCPRCKGKDGSRLIADDLGRIHDYLAKRDIRMAIWGDKLMNIISGGRDYGGRAIRWVDPRRHADHTMAETYHAVEMAPKDMLILDWYWSLDPSSERYFGEHGFEEIYGNFGDNFSPATFWQWDQRSSATHVLGAEIPTWCDTSEWAFGHNGVFFNMLVAANMLWWEHYCDRERERTLNTVTAHLPGLRDRFSGQPAPSRSAGAKAAPVSLEAAFNSAPAFSRSLLSSLPFALDLSQDCWAVTADDGQPVSRPIQIGRMAKSLVFLHSAQPANSFRPSWAEADPLRPTKRDLLGHYEVRYADGAIEQIPLRFGENITRADLRYGEDISAIPYWADLVWQGQDERGRAICLYNYEWINPHPDKRIAQITAHYTAAGLPGQISLLGLAAIS